MDIESEPDWWCIVSSHSGKSSWRCEERSRGEKSGRAEKSRGAERDYATGPHFGMGHHNKRSDEFSWSPVLPTG